MLGGGYVNTELRELREPRVFDYFDYVTLDDGERPLLDLLAHLAGRRAPLLRTFVRKGGAVVLETDATQHDVPPRDTGTPTYDGLPLDRLPVAARDAEPDAPAVVGRPLEQAHARARLLLEEVQLLRRLARLHRPLRPRRRPTSCVERIEALIAETGQTGFHFVDEAAPPAALRALAEAPDRRAA